jgi:hypothetical protein
VKGSVTLIFFLRQGDRGTDNEVKCQLHFLFFFRQRDDDSDNGTMGQWDRGHLDVGYDCMRFILQNPRGAIPHTARASTNGLELICLPIGYSYRPFLSHRDLGQWNHLGARE